MTASGGRPTITVRLPSGWARAALAGIESAFFAWLIPVIVGVTGFWVVASNPWLREVSWEAGASIGASFWAISLGGDGNLGGVHVGFFPLLWSLLQVLFLRGFLLQTRDSDVGASWGAVPAFTLTSTVLVLASADATAWRVILGSLCVSALAALWSDYSARHRRGTPMAGKWQWLWDGIRLGALWLLVAAGTSLVLVVISWSVNAGSLRSGFERLGPGAGFFATMLFMFFPNLIGWAWSWITGAGFIGPTGDAVNWSNPRTSDFVIPYWTLVPVTSGSHLIPWIPVLLGVVLGALTAYRRRRVARLVTNLRPVAVACVFFTVVLAVWLMLSGGSLGEGKLAYLGPQVLATTGWTVVKMLLPLVAVVAIFHPQTFSLVRQGTQRTQAWVQRTLQKPKDQEKPTVTTAPEGVPLPDVDGTSIHNKRMPAVSRQSSLETEVIPEVEQGRAPSLPEASRPQEEHRTDQSTLE